jgi:hypothetical protein
MSRGGHSPSTAAPGLRSLLANHRSGSVPAVRHEWADLTHSEAGPWTRLPESAVELPIGPCPGRRRLVGVFPYTPRTMGSSLLCVLSPGVAAGEAGRLEFGSGPLHPITSTSELDVTGSDQEMAEPRSEGDGGTQQGRMPSPEELAQSSAERVGVALLPAMSVGGHPAVLTVPIS